MPLRRINQFPEGNSSLSNDDVLLFMDDPAGSGIPKKITLGQLSNSIGISDAIIYANVSIKTDTKNNLDSYIPPLGVMVYSTDDKTLRIGDGNSFGGQQIKSPSYFKSINGLGSTKQPSDGLTLDPVLNVSLPALAPNETGIYKGECGALFISAPTSGDYSNISSPIINMFLTDNYGIIDPITGTQKLTQLLGDNNELVETDTQISKNITMFPLFDYNSIAIAEPDQDNQKSIFSYSSEFYFSVSTSGIFGCYWGSNGNNNISIRDAVLYVERIN